VSNRDSSAAAQCDAADHSNAMEAHQEAARRDPRQFPFGYLAGDPATGALGPLVWFKSPGELYDFLLGPEIYLLLFDEPDTLRIRASLRRAIGSTRDITRLDRDMLSAAFEGWSEIVWIGTFGDLCSRGGDMPTRIRRAFRSEHELGDHAGPIADDELDAFVAWLAAT
jgi:hypothetical protein